MILKQNLYNQCQEFIDNRFETIQNTIKDIQKSLLSETKSSAGDKHETGRAMLQLEREKAGQQLAEIQKIKEILLKLFELWHFVSISGPKMEYFGPVPKNKNVW